jgi:hypothetical protein
VIIKERLHKHLPLSKAVQIIANQTADLGCKYDAKINRDRKSLPRLLDRRAFAAVYDKITAYALNQAIKGWSATKNMADKLEEDQLELNFIPGIECKLGCELPLRYSLPCKHWLYCSGVEELKFGLGASGTNTKTPPVDWSHDLEHRYPGSGILIYSYVVAILHLHRKFCVQSLSSSFSFTRRFTSAFIFILESVLCLCIVFVYFICVRFSPWASPILQYLRYSRDSGAHRRHTPLFPSYW